MAYSVRRLARGESGFYRGAGRVVSRIEWILDLLEQGDNADDPVPGRSTGRSF